MIIKLTHAHIIGTIIAYIFGVFLVPLVINFSKKEGLVDVPNERKIHTTPISRIGGVAIWTSTMLTFLCLVFLSYYPYGSLLSGILLGSSLMFLLGLVDDIYNLDAKFKLFIQISIATLVYLLGVRIDSIPFIGDLGLWNGRRSGYKMIDSGNIKDCLFSDTDYTEWYVDKYGDLRADAVHHDGTNHYLYRAFKDGVSDTQKENLQYKIYCGKATRADITRVTKRLGDEIAKVYGFPIPKQRTAAELSR